MILIDNRAGNTQYRNHCQELLGLIRRLGVKAELTQLEYADFAFQGNGPNGDIYIGIERKTLSDILNCIDDARFAAHQRPGLLANYSKSYLLVEGIWKPDFNSGYLMELVQSLTWRPCRYRSAMVRYSKLFRYLLSVQLGGQGVIITRDIDQTAFDVCEIFHYYQKKWTDHTSLMETQKLNLPSLNGTPSLVRKWAADLPGVGVKHSLEAEKVFRSPLSLAISEESDWLTIPGIGAKLAKSIINAIHGK